MLPYICEAHAFYKTPSAGDGCSSSPVASAQSRLTARRWSRVSHRLCLPVFTTVCAERKRCFIWIDGPDASMPGGDLHPFVPQHCAPSPKVTASHLCSSCSLCLLLPSCSTGSQSRDHCMTVLIPRKQTCLAEPLRCRRTWKM